MSRKYQFRGQIRIVTLTTALSISGVFCAFLAPIAHADSLSVPVLNPTIVSGEYRNVFNAALSVTGDSLQSVTIEVKRSDGSALSPRVYAESIAGQTSVALRWSTTTENDGDYRIFYSATDTEGQTTQESYPISINNSQPSLALNSAADGRTVGGAISLFAASFVVKIDSVVRAVQPTIAQTSDVNGNYAWSFTVPSDVSEGSHDFDITVTSFFSGKSANATGTLRISSPQAATTVNPESDQGGALALEDPAKEVGQFIAPPMPSSNQTQLFGVSTTDLTKKQPETLTVVSAPQQAAPLSVKRGTVSTDSVPIAPSESGWLIFGTAWYWWLGLIVGASSVAFVGSRYIQLPLRRSLIIGAESQ